MADERGTDQLPDATPAQLFVTPAGEPDWAGLAALHPVALVTELMRIADARMSGRTGADEDAAAAALPAPVRLIWLLTGLDLEVGEGTLVAYVANAHGRYAEQAAAALDSIGAPRMAQIVRGAEAIGNARRAGDPGRHEVAQISEFSVARPYRDLPADDALRALTDEYWTAAAAEDWGARLGRSLHRAVHAAARTGVDP